MERLFEEVEVAYQWQRWKGGWRKIVQLMYDALGDDVKNQQEKKRDVQNSSHGRCN